MIKTHIKGYKTLSDIGGDADMAAFYGGLWWYRVAPWRMYGMKNMPWWYYQARNRRISKQRMARYEKERLS